MNIKKEIFHFLMRMGKNQSKKITGVLEGLNGNALGEQRHNFIRLMRAKSRRFGKLFHQTIGSLPAGVKTESIKISGIRSLKFTPAHPGQKVIYYIHGGGFIIGLDDSLHHHSYLPNLAYATNATIYEIDYRVAPEHPYPAALDDVMEGYQGLLEMGIDPRNMVVMGDSAGGALVFSLLLKLRDLGFPLPLGCVTMSPVTAPVHTVESFTTRQEIDPLFTQDMLCHVYTPAYMVAEHYDSPYLHPIYGEYEGLPPMLIFVGGCDMLHDHSVLVADKAQLAGVDVTLDIHDEMIHAYPVLYDLYDEAKDAMKKVVVFMDRLSSVSGA
jgi:acetyl esterase/lipase